MVRFLPFLLWLLAAQAAAHELRPPIVTIDLAEAPTVTVRVRANLEALLAGIGTRHADTDDAPQADRYRALRALSPAALEIEAKRALPPLLDAMRLDFDGLRAPLRLRGLQIPDRPDTRTARISELVLESDIPPGARTLRWTWPPELGDNILRVRLPDGRMALAAWLRDGRPSDPVPVGELAPQPPGDGLRDYLALGFVHIVPQGTDHILFVLGLFLLSLHWKPLLVQISAFTLAHTLTLALSTYGVIDLPRTVVEPLIAASIAFVAVENLLSPRLRPWRVALVFGFGLLHGLGFAGALAGLGLPPERQLAALIAFNVGVELGQLAVIAVAWVLVRPWANSADYRRLIAIPASLAIAAIGLWWTWSRLPALAA